MNSPFRDTLGNKDNCPGEPCLGPALVKEKLLVGKESLKSCVALNEVREVCFRSQEQIAITTATSVKTSLKK